MDKTWKNKTILYLVSQTFTMLGSMIVMYAISWHISLTTKSSIMLTISVVCGFLPQVFMSLFAGVWADRYNKKRLIILADSFTALVTLALALAFASGYDHLWLLFAASALRSVGTGIQQPAIGAFLPEIVPEEELLRINGINQSIMGVVMIVAPIIAGALIKINITYLFYIDVVTAIIGISLLMLVKSKPLPKADAPAVNIFEDIAIGFRYITGTKWLKQLMAYHIVFALMFGPCVFLTPLMVIRSFGDESWRLVSHEIVFAVGTILGGLCIGIVSKRIKNTTIMLILANIFFGLTTLIMGFSPNFIFYLVVMFFVGTSVPFMGSCSMTIIQTKTDVEYLGRVFSVSTIIGSAAMPLSIIIFGPIADTKTVSIEMLLIASGAVMAIVSVAALLLKDMIKAGEPAVPVVEAEEIV